MVKLDLPPKEVKLETNWKKYSDSCVDRYTFPTPYIEKYYFGCDPGTVNFGFCILHGVTGVTYQVKFVRLDTPILRMCQIFDLLNRITDYQFPIFETGVIEYAAFNQRFRQVELAEQRLAVAFWAYRRTKNVHFINPITIRKIITGSAKIHPKIVINNVSPDAGIALCCAKIALDK